MSEEIKYTLNVQSVINPLAKEKGETNFVLVSNGTADFDRVISEMMAVNPGLERETIEMVVKLEHRIIQKLTMNGMRVSNGLFSAVATPKGKGGSTWDPKVNELNISITQGNSWRDAIRDTTVNVIGYKSDVMYITTITNAATRATNGTATQGRPLKVEGSYLKVVGSDPSVGIYFIDAEGEETQVTEDFWSVNQPKTLSFVVPAGLENGVYTLRITTQYSGKNNTYVHLNNPIIRALYDRHGKELNFVGVVITNENVTLADKQRSSSYAVKLASMLGVDAVVISEEGFGNPDADLVLNCVKAEKAGIRTVLVTDEFAGANGASQSLADSCVEGDACVTGGNANATILLPPMQKVIGDIGQADVIAGGFFGSLKPDGSLEVELQAIMAATNELGFNRLGAYTI